MYKLESNNMNLKYPEYPKYQQYTLADGTFKACSQYGGENLTFDGPTAEDCLRQLEEYTNKKAKAIFGGLLKLGALAVVIIGGIFLAIGVANSPKPAQDTQIAVQDNRDPYATIGQANADAAQYIREHPTTWREDGARANQQIDDAQALVHEYLKNH